MQKPEPLKPHIQLEELLRSFCLERESLTQAEVRSILGKGLQLLEGTKMVDTLLLGGCAIFPHASILRSGDQTAAVAHAALSAAHKSNKNQILVIGVLHPLAGKNFDSHKLAKAGHDMLGHPCRGIFGPGLPGKELLKWEFSIDNFLFFLDHAARIKKMKPPKIIVRFPNHVVASPNSLPGIKKLKQLAKESIVVATGDLYHHGVNYGIPKEKALSINDDALTQTRNIIFTGFDILNTRGLRAYIQYCYDYKCDTLEVGQILKTILGLFQVKIHNLRLVDVSNLFIDLPKPNWVAAALVSLKKVDKL